MLGFFKKPIVLVTGLLTVVGFFKQSESRQDKILSVVAKTPDGIGWLFDKTLGKAIDKIGDDEPHRDDRYSREYAGSLESPIKPSLQRRPYAQEEQEPQVRSAHYSLPQSRSSRPAAIKYRDRTPHEASVDYTQAEWLMQEIWRKAELPTHMLKQYAKDCAEKIIDTYHPKDSLLEKATKMQGCIRQLDPENKRPNSFNSQYTTKMFKHKVSIKDMAISALAEVRNELAKKIGSGKTVMNSDGDASRAISQAIAEVGEQRFAAEVTARVAGVNQAKFLV